jgi:hypothetical protein
MRQQDRRRYWQLALLGLIGAGILAACARGTVTTQPTASQHPDLATQTIVAAMPTGSTLLGVFEGITPCSERTRPLPQIPVDTNCEQMIWKFTLYQDQAGQPSTYLYRGTQMIREGAWTITRGIKGDPDAVVYQLKIDTSQQPVSFLKVDDNTLYLLDRDMQLLVGDALFSYTLSRADKDVS